VIDERLRSRELPDGIVQTLHDCSSNAARYAPRSQIQELAALVPKVEGVLRELRGLR
jgi:hypothetical protein